MIGVIRCKATKNPHFSFTTEENVYESGVYNENALAR